MKQAPWECALNMGQRSHYGAAKDEQLMLRKEECTPSTAQRPKDAAVMDVQIKLSMEECDGCSNQVHL